MKETVMEKVESVTQFTEAESRATKQTGGGVQSAVTTALVSAQPAIAGSVAYNFTREDDAYGPVT